jgi:E3 ubiquitin-protein ligase MARCH6
MTPVNAIVSVVGWAFVCPLLVGYLLAASFPAAQSSWAETFWMGYLMFNLSAWLLCCFRLKSHRHRRHRHDHHHHHHHHRHERRGDEPQPANFVDLLMVDDDRLEDDDDDDLDEDDDDLLDDDDDDDDDDELIDNDLDEDHIPPHSVDPDDFVACLRKSFRQLLFTVTVHENDDVRLRRDSLEDRCFDVGFFQAKVLRPALVFLSLLVVGPTVVVELALLVFACESLVVKNTAFGVATLVLGTSVGAVRSHAAVARWLAELCESIRNERYLIGRQLQDMAR